MPKKAGTYKQSAARESGGGYCARKNYFGMYRV